MMIEIDMSYALLVVDIAKIVCRMICFLVAQRRLPTSPDLFISITPTVFFLVVSIMHAIQVVFG